MALQIQTQRGQVTVQGQTANKHSNWAWVVNFQILQRALSNYFILFFSGEKSAEIMEIQVNYTSC